VVATQSSLRPPPVGLAEAVGRHWEFATRKAGDDFDRERGRAVVEAYRNAGGTARPEDDDLLVPLIRVKRVLEVLRAPTDRQVDWDYLEHNLRAFRKLG
jgi:hypothetical protein